MNITASSIHDLKAIKTLFRTSICRLFNPKISIVLYNVLQICFLIFFILVRFILKDFEIGLILFVCIFGIIIVNYLYFIAPLIQYKSLRNFAKMENHFNFQDDNFMVESKDESFSGTNTMEYEAIYKLVETKDYFFIYINQSQTYIVQKDTIEGGSVDDVRIKLLKAVGKKFRFCKI